MKETHHPFTIDEVEQLGRSLTPHMTRAFGAELDLRLAPIRSDIALLKRKSSFWGAVGGALTAVGLFFAQKFLGSSGS